MNLQQAHRWFFYADWTMLTVGALAFGLSLGLTVYASFPRNQGRRKGLFLRALVCFATFALTLVVQASVTIPWMNQPWTPLRIVLFAAPAVAILGGLLGSIYCATHALTRYGGNQRRQAVFRSLVASGICGIAIAPHAITMLIPIVVVEDRGNRPGTLARIGERLPDFELTTVDGTPFRLLETRGRFVVVNFFATWCGPCQLELPQLQAVWEEFRHHENFRMLVIGREESDETLRAFQRNSGFTFPMAADPEASIYGRFATRLIPRTYLISDQGIVVHEWTGTSKDEISRLRQFLRDELNQAPTIAAMHRPRGTGRLAERRSNFATR